MMTLINMLAMRILTIRMAHLTVRRGMMHLTSIIIRENVVKFL